MSEIKKKSMAITTDDVPSVLPLKHTNTDAWMLVVPKTADNKNVAFVVTEMRPGGATDWDTHPGEHVYFGLSGHGKVYVEDDVYDLRPGVCIYMDIDAKHRLDVIGNETLRFISIVAPVPPFLLNQKQ